MLRETELVKSKNGSGLKGHSPQIDERKQKQKLGRVMVTGATNRIW